MSLAELTTPALILDRSVLVRNCERMAERMQAHRVRLRPHLKTAKSARIASIATHGQFGGITVSTLAEARYFAERGYRDILYAVGIAPNKLDEAAALQREGVQVTLVTDNRAAALAAAERAASLETEFRFLVEVDTGGQRGGVSPESEDLIALGQFITAAPRLHMEGVMTHAGQSYHCRGALEVAQVAEAERAGVTLAASRLRWAGLRCPVVSAGSTPTAVHATSLLGITEMRPGVYMFYDLDQLGIGTCEMEDIAISVLATVIGHNRRARRILVDAGALALSKDISASEHLEHIGYGIVCPGEGTQPTSGLCISEVHQEHGLIASTNGAEPPYERFPIGSRVRILPNHACITAAGHSRYQVVDGANDVVDVWDRVSGW